MKTQTIHKLYNEIDINFLINPNNSNIMINATQMAKAFNKRVDVFLKSDHAQNFIHTLELTPFGGRSEPLKKDEILKTINGSVTWMHRVLALKFAAWLDIDFELWVYSTIDDILFGNYKKHWTAHATQEEAKLHLQDIKEKMLENPTQELILDYFRTEEIIKNTISEKRKAIQQQITLFNYLQKNN